VPLGTELNAHYKKGITNGYNMNNNGIAHDRHLCKKITSLGCLRSLIIVSFENINIKI
jgi:hypothetical protein